MVTFDDGRTTIDAALDPGDECEVQLDVTAPAQPGHYVLEVDALQEWIAWFANTVKLPVEVAAIVDVRSGERGEAAEGYGDAVLRAPSPHAWRCTSWPAKT